MIYRNVCALMRLVALIYGIGFGVRRESERENVNSHHRLQSFCAMRDMPKKKT